MSTAAIVIIGIAIVMVWFWYDVEFASRDRSQRGERLISHFLAKRRAARHRRKIGGSPCYWGVVDIPDRFASEHFMLLGGSGSGKTISLRLLMQSVFALEERREGRGVIFDVKRDAVSTLAGMGIGMERMTIVNPFDQRGSSWDIAADINTPAACKAAAALLVPERDRNVFFVNAARDVVEEMLCALNITQPGKWSLHDIVEASRNKQHFDKIVRKLGRSEDLVGQYQDREATWADVYSSIRTELSKLEVVADSWKEAETSFCVADWMQGQGFMVLGFDTRVEEAMSCMNALLLQVLSREVTGREGEWRDGPDTWFFLDELKSLGKLPFLGNLLSTGRSKGLSVCFGLQDVEGLRAIYGRDEADTICGQPKSVAVLNLNSGVTAKFACEEIFGAHMANGQEVPNVLKSELMRPAEVVSRDGLIGFYRTCGVGIYKARIRPRKLFGKMLKPKSIEVADFVENKTVNKFPAYKEAMDRSKEPESARGGALSEIR